MADDRTYFPGDWSVFITKWRLTADTESVSPIQVGRTLHILVSLSPIKRVPFLLGSCIGCQTSEIVREKPGAFSLSKSYLIKVESNKSFSSAAVQVSPLYNWWTWKAVNSIMSFSR